MPDFDAAVLRPFQLRKFDPSHEIRTSVSPGLVAKTQRGALFSADFQYRYVLYNFWKAASPYLINFLMLNPSTADEAANDPTVARCGVRAKAWGFSGYVITNLFAYRATNPREMLAHKEPIGEYNDDYIVDVAQQCAVTVCAWGNDGTHLRRSAAIAKLLAEKGIPLHALRLSKDGEPGHPLYLSYDLKPLVWNRVRRTLGG